MIRHELDIYVEMYKRGLYDTLPIGEYSDGNYFYPTEKQVLALSYLNDEFTTNVGYGGSARCFTGETLINTQKGHVRIDNIIEGDYVLSYNESTKKREYKKVLKTYRFSLAEPPKMIIFANNLKCTYKHEFLFNGKWTKACELRERAMEIYRWELPHLEQRKVSNNKPQGEQKTKAYETSIRRQWLFKNNVGNRREKQNNKNAQRGGKSIYSKSFELASCKSYRLQQGKQLCGELRMDDNQTKRYSFSKRRSIKQLQKRRKAAHKLFKTWGGQWNGNIDKNRCIRDKGKVRSEKIYKKNVIRRIWSSRMHNKRCYSSPFMESREITLKEFIGSQIQHIYTPIYDLHVEDNHNYTVTRENIIVHNSGKSLIECVAIIFDCFAYKGIAWGLARKELTTLKRTVLITLFKQLAFYGIEEGKDYTYNQQLNKIIFKNSSEIFLIDTAYKPSDPLNTRFGGFELTKCAIDESNETELVVVEKLFERTGWRLNDKYNIKRKVFECFNPAKNHVYFRYFVPKKNNNEQEHIKFIAALPSDNPHPSVAEWVEDMIKTSDHITVQRQVYGNFEYDDDPSALCDYDSVVNLFTNDHVLGGTKYISADLAMKGRDRFVTGYWDGLICTVAIDKKQTDGKEIEELIKALKNSKGVPNTNIVADSDGLGGYLESYMRNIVEFHGGATATDKEYFNLKSECAFKLAEKINKNEIKINCSNEQREAIISEITVCLKRENLDADTQKKKLLSKDEMKKRLGHSPDYLDMLLMRMYFDIKKKKSTIYW